MLDWMLEQVLDDAQMDRDVRGIMEQRAYDARGTVIAPEQEFYDDVW